MKRVHLFKRLALIVMVFLLPLVVSATFAVEEEAYPFKRGEDAFVNGVTWTGPTTNDAYWQFFQVSFDQSAVDLSNVTYVAVQIRMDLGSPGFTYGLLQNGDRYSTAAGVADEKPVYFLNEDGNVETLGNIMYGSVWIPQGKQGALLLPIANLGWQWNNNASDLKSVQHFYMTTDSQFNNNWAITVGEVGFYEGEPAAGTFTNLLDLSVLPKANKYYYDSMSTTTLEVIKPEYPHPTGTTAYNGGVRWTNTLQSASENDTWQALFLNFAVVDLTDATFLAVQYRADSGAPGITWGIESGDDRFSTQLDSKPVYFMEQDGTMSLLTNVLYSSVNVAEGKNGLLLIPMDAIVHQFGSGTNTLATAKSIVLTTNSKYNYNYQLSIGEVGFYNGVLGDSDTVYTKLDIESTYNAIPSDSTTEVIDASDYPLQKGEKAFNGGQSWFGPMTASGADTWESIFFNFTETVDLSAATYIAVQYRSDSGAPGLTWGVESSGTRYSTQVDGLPVYFMSEETGITELGANVLYGAVSIQESKTGMVLIPVSTLVYQFGDNQNTLATVNNLLITTNTLYNYNFQISVGSVGYFDGEIGSEGTTYHPIDVAYYYNTGPNTTMELIDVTDWQIAENITYPFRSGENAYQNGKIWVAPATGSTVDDFQSLTIHFDQSSVDFTNASYLAIQMANTLGNPGLTYALKSGNNLLSIAGVADGSTVYYVKENGDIATAASVLYSSVTTSISNGTLLIPMAALGWTDESGANNLATVASLVITTNRRYNYNFQVKFGEIGFYQGELGSGEEVFTKLLDLSTQKSSQFVTKGTVTNESSLIETSERSLYGDTIISFTATGKTAANFGIWTGGSYGLVEMTLDSYGDTAIKLKATGSNPTGDAYTAIDIAATGGFSWENRKGITFWARNDSNGEISFNIEVDNKITATGVSDRFNIKQGYRYYLYDVNTEKTSIYMTKPTATLPVGFEGWVRIPFEAFFRADWSNNGVTKDQFMKTGTTVTYLAVTIHSSTYLNMEFSLNKFGAYSVTPSFISAYVEANANRLTIPQLMELDEEV